MLGSFKIYAITPYKYQDNELNEISYVIPASERYTLTQNISASVSPIVYYFSPPAKPCFPIAIVCGGSSFENDIQSIIHVHRYFLQEFHHLGVGVLTIEQQGVDGDRVNVAEFMKNYTRSNRLNDHRNVMNFLIGSPLQNWNQHFLLFGIREGGAIVTTLASEFEDRVIATVNWAGAHGFSWQDQLWDYMQKYLKQSSWMTQFRCSLPTWMPFSKKFDFPQTREAYDTLMSYIAEHPTVDMKFAGMTYKYHADVMKHYSKFTYEQFTNPYLVVVGSDDLFVDSINCFIENSMKVDNYVTSICLAGVGHNLKQNAQSLEKTFSFFKRQIMMFSLIKESTVLRCEIDEESD